MADAVGHSWAPWKVLVHWAPFKIDALGLVTLLGAEEVDAAVGRLVRSRYVEYMPLLGAYVIAGDRFRAKAAGFNLYNITKGIHTTELAPWLTRWMLSQDFETTRSYIRWTITEPPSRKSDVFIASLISLIFNGFLVAGTILSRDWYGFANALAMVASILVRAYIMKANRHSVDVMVSNAMGESGKAIKPAAKKDKPVHSKEVDDEETDVEDGQSIGLAKLNTSLRQRHKKPNKSRHHPTNTSRGDDAVKVLIILSDSKAVTMRLPGRLLIPPSVFIENPKVILRTRYNLVRWLGWLAFAVHIVAIGMSDLATQLYTVVLIVVPTVLVVSKLGCDDSKWISNIMHWKNKYITKKYSESDVEKADVNQFLKKRECWIGSRLKAEIYEWPEGFEFLPTRDGNGHEGFTTGKLPAGRERSKKRQDLYAWLQLVTDEELSMDKWDLFPHIRDDNREWWRTYKKKKNALKIKLDKLQQHDDIGPPIAEPLATLENPQPGGGDERTTESTPDDDVRLIDPRDRTMTKNWVSLSDSAGSPPSSPRKGRRASMGTAFPASMPMPEEPTQRLTTSPETVGPPRLETIDTGDSSSAVGDTDVSGRHGAGEGEVVLQPLDARQDTDPDAAYRA